MNTNEATAKTLTIVRQEIRTTTTEKIGEAVVTYTFENLKDEKPSYISFSVVRNPQTGYADITGTATAQGNLDFKNQHFTADCITIYQEIYKTTQQIFNQEFQTK